MTVHSQTVSANCTLDTQPIIIGPIEAVNTILAMNWDANTGALTVTISEYMGIIRNIKIVVNSVTNEVGVSDDSAQFFCRSTTGGMITENGSGSILVTKNMVRSISIFGNGVTNLINTTAINSSFSALQFLRIEGKGGSDVITVGSDVTVRTLIRGNGGIDTIYGGSGSDDIDGGMDGDTIYGGAGNDTIKGGDNDATLGDALNFRETIYGGAGNDTIYGSVGNDTIYGEDGDDALYGQTDNARDNSGDASHDNDFIYGGTGNDQIFGQRGEDTLYGDDGNDRINSGFHVDNVFGGEGNDIFLLDSLSYNGIYDGGNHTSPGRDSVTMTMFTTNRLALTSNDNREVMLYDLPTNVPLPGRSDVSNVQTKFTNIESISYKEEGTGSNGFYLDARQVTLPINIIVYGTPNQPDVFFGGAGSDQFLSEEFSDFFQD
jgi:Ca2+-binding RTX toxin-like protein